MTTCKRCLLALLLTLGMAGSLAGGQVELVSSADSANPSATPDGISLFQALSADGRYAVFTSTAVNVIPGQKDANAGNDVFLSDQVTGITMLVSHAADAVDMAGNAVAERAGISADGRYVFFNSKATNLVPGQVDAPGTDDVFLFDRVSGSIALVSRSASSAARTGNASSTGSDTSGDGRYVVFLSSATDLVAGQEDANSEEDVFLYDRVSRTTTLVSHAAGSNTKTGNGDSRSANRFSISLDGNQILFFSTSSDLLPGVTTNRHGQLYLFHRVSRTTTLVSHSFRSATEAVVFGADDAVLSDDGNYVAFVSPGLDLVSSVPNPQGLSYLYLYHRPSGLVSPIPRTDDPTASIEPPRISADGRYIAFVAFPNGRPDVFLYDRVSDGITLVSASLTTAPVGSSPPSALLISADGRYVAFGSEYVDLIPAQTDRLMTEDVFLYDRVSRTLRLVTHTPSSLIEATGGNPIAISEDGRYVGFSSSNREVVEGGGDYNKQRDAFLYDGNTADIALVSSREGTPSRAAGFSVAGTVSADGRYVLFESAAANLVPGQTRPRADTLFFQNGADVFLHDRVTKAKILVSRSAASPTTPGDNTSEALGLSADGRYALFFSRATDLVPEQNDANGNGRDLFLFDRATGTTTLVSHSSDSLTTTGDQDCLTFGQDLISQDGRYVAFRCAAANLVPGQIDTNFRDDIFLYDRVSGGNILVSHAAGSPDTASDKGGTDIALSNDGRYLAYASDSVDLIAGQNTLFSPNIFLFDRVSGTTVLVSHAPSSPSTTGNGPSAEPSISADGRFIAFESEAENLAPGTVLGNLGVYLFDRVSGGVTLVARSGRDPRLSDDGRFIVFTSTSNTVIPGQIDRNGTADVFLYDRSSGNTTLVSRAGSPATTGNKSSGAISISADGSIVMFSSGATDLVPGSALSGEGLFLYHRTSGTIELATLSASRPVLSASGQVVAFDSRATDLTIGDLNASEDVYLYLRGNASGGTIPLPPCKLLDTRRRADRPALRSDTRRTVRAAGVCGVPATAKSVSVTVTALQATGKGNLRFYAGNDTVNSSGILRFEKNATRSGAFNLPLATNGAGTLAILPFVAGKGTVQVVVEVNGYSQ